LANRSGNTRPPAHQLGGRICAHAAAVRRQIKREELDALAALALAADSGCAEWAAWMESWG
jgi:hypothetical protein